MFNNLKYYIGQNACAIFLQDDYNGWYYTSSENWHFIYGTIEGINVKKIKNRPIEIYYLIENKWFSEKSLIANDNLSEKELIIKAKQECEKRNSE